MICLIIAHRGNTDGPNIEMENNPAYVMKALQDGWEVEVDVWLIDDKWYLGHDYPKYEVDLEFLQQQKIWAHAKNKEALSKMILAHIHCFWHEDDAYTLTSEKYIWASPFQEPSGISISVMPEYSNNKKATGFVGVCTDFPKRY